MNVISYLNGENVITDHSPCVDPIIRSVAIWANDHADNETRQRMIPYVMRAMNTKTDDPTVIDFRISESMKLLESIIRMIKEREATFGSIISKAAVKAMEVDLECLKTPKLHLSLEEVQLLVDLTLRDNLSRAEIFVPFETRFEAVLGFLDKVCNPSEEPNSVIIERAKKLVELNQCETA